MSFLHLFQVTNVEAVAVVKVIMHCVVHHVHKGTTSEHGLVQMGREEVGEEVVEKDSHGWGEGGRECQS